MTEVRSTLISGKHQHPLSISVKLQLHWLAPQVGGKFNFGNLDWKSRCFHGFKLPLVAFWCQSPRSDLMMSSVFPPWSLQTIYTEQFLSCGPFRNRPCTRGCIADFLVKENESKMLSFQLFQSGWRPYQDKKCTQGFGRLCALKIDRLEKSDFMAGFSCLIHTGLWRCFTLSLFLNPSHND